MYLYVLSYNNQNIGVYDDLEKIRERILSVYDKHSGKFNDDNNPNAADWVAKSEKHFMQHQSFEVKQTLAVSRSWYISTYKVEKYELNNTATFYKNYKYRPEVLTSFIDS